MIIDGKAISAKRQQELSLKIAEFKSSMGKTPKLVAIIVGEDPASVLYVNLKAKRAMEVGIDSEIVKLPKDVTDLQLILQIKKLNADPEVTGVLVQLPFPRESAVLGHESEILETIDPTKDVDCLTSQNLGLIALGKTRFYPATVKGILIALSEGLGDRAKRLEESKDWKILHGLKAVVVGRSDIVGKPTAAALISLGATVTVCNSKTPNLGEITNTADVLISATGVPGLIKAQMVKKGAIVIDVGINQNAEGKVVGDVDPAVLEVAGAISPVPGGVGPLTVVSLLENTLLATSETNHGE